MKKIIITFILFFGFSLNASAYNNKYFEVTLPEGYDLLTESSGIYQWVNGELGSNYVVSVALNSENVSLIDYTKEEKAVFVSDLIDELEEQYLVAYEEEIDVLLVTSDEIRLNGHDGIHVEVMIEDFLNTGSDMYQYIDVLESKHYLYSLTYSTALLTYDEVAYEGVRNSLKIEDDKTTALNLLILKWGIIIVVVFLLMIGSYYFGRRGSNGKKFRK